MGRLGLVTCRVPVYGLAGIEVEKLAPHPIMAVEETHDEDGGAV